MSAIIVNLSGLGLIAWIVWYFWLSSAASAIVAMSETGVQEISIVVRGGYTPDTLQVEAGRPVRLTFNRQEADPCSEMVVFEDFGIAADLPPGDDVILEFTPDEPGLYEFACQMGMLRGKVIAT